MWEREQGWLARESPRSERVSLSLERAWREPVSAGSPERKSWSGPEQENPQAWLWLSRPGLANRQEWSEPESA